jgi:aldehyde:ferredoxin oxidoreductase
VEDDIVTISGEVLRFNLDKESDEFVDWLEEDRSRKGSVSLRRLLGGIGFAFEEFLDTKPCTDPSGKFIINTGFLTGLPRNGVPSGCTRTYVSFNSASKEKEGHYGIGYAAAGGLSGPNIKSCGIDGVILEGRAKNPIGVMIDASGENREVSTIDLDPELTTLETVDKCFELGYRGSVVVGPAAFRGVTFSSVMVSYMPHDHVRAAARGGPGRALAGMNVKAVAFQGGKDRTPKPKSDDDEFKQWMKNLNRELASGSGTEKYKKHGTWGGNWAYLVPLKALPAENFGNLDPKDAYKLDPEYLKSKGYTISQKGCACPIMCWKIPKDPSGKTLWKIDYENVDLLGPNCGIYDIHTISEAIKMCDAQGLDAMSAGGVIAWFFEHNKRAGEEPTFGDGKALLDMIDKIARREGIGELLSKGVKKASEELGDRDIAMQVKGLEGAGYPFWSNLGYAFALRGACHTSLGTYTIGLANPDGVADPEWWADQIAKAIPASMICQMNGSCYFTRKVLVPELPRLVENLIGVKASKEEIDLAATQTYIIARLIDNVNGFDYTDDWMPDRTFRVSTTPELLERTRSLFYGKMGFDDQGKVTEETLERHGLRELTDYV